MPTKAQSHTTTDHDEIREWAEARGAKPSCVKKTGGSGDIGILRLDFPGYSGADSLQEISWDDWFEKFDDQNLALLYQDETAEGAQSNFNKIVSRETAAENESRGHHSNTGKSSSSGSKAASNSKSAAKKASAKKTSSKKTASK